MDTDYRSRLGVMEDWYRDFLRSEDRIGVLLRDFAPHRDYLGKLRGSVIDIGGGAGLPARFLAPDVRYVVADPSRIWRSPEWNELSCEFRRSGPEPRFVDAPGEDVPFDDGEFDAALSFWTLNHVRDPAACIAEMARVLKPGGTARLVLEDVEPGWADLVLDAARRAGAFLAGRRGLASVHMRLPDAFAAKATGKWPLQDDHLLIRDRDLVEWLKAVFQVERRSWIGGCLTYDVVKPSA